MAIEKVTINTYADGTTVMSGIRNNKGIPIFKENDTLTATKVTTWYDGTPMDESKADGKVYLRHKSTGDYYLVNLPNWGQSFLEKDTMAQMRALNSVDELLVKIGYYKGVKLNGYYSKGDKQSLEYSVSQVSLSDDGGYIVQTPNLKLEHKPSGDVNGLDYGMITQYAGIDVDNGERLQKAMDYAQRNAPNYTISVYIPYGWYKFKTGVDISANGWSGRLYGDGVGAYSTRLIADNTLASQSIHALIYTKYVMDGTTRKDRFGKTFVSNGNFEISNIIFSGGEKTPSGTYTDYTTDSVCKYCVDISSSSYIRVEKCEFNRCIKGLSASKWQGVIKNNHFKNSTYGLVLSERNDFNTPAGASGDAYSLALNNMVVSQNNFSTNKHHVFNDGGGYFLIIKDNVFDLSAGSSLVIRNFQHVICNDNYFEANNREDLGHSVTYIGFAGSVTETIKANCIFYKGSNYNSEISILDFNNNQIANNTGVVDNPFIALSGVSNYSITKPSFRAYENGGVLFFGVGSWSNAQSVINSSGLIDFGFVNDKQKIRYASNLVNKGLSGLKIIDRSSVNQVYPYKRSDLLDTNLFSFINGDPSLTATFRPIFVAQNTNEFNNENYRVTLNSSKYCWAKYDFTKDSFKPSNLVVDFDVLPITTTANISFTVQLYIDGSSTPYINEPIGRYIVDSGKKAVKYSNTYILPQTYNTVEVRVLAGATGDYVFSNFCIRSSNVEYSTAGKSVSASTSVKGLVNQTVALANISQADLVAITTADATDLATALTLLNELKAKYNLNVTLTNALKASQNTELTNQRTAGQQAI